MKKKKEKEKEIKVVTDVETDERRRGVGKHDRKQRKKAFVDSK